MLIPVDGTGNPTSTAAGHGGGGGDGGGGWRWVLDSGQHDPPNAGPWERLQLKVRESARGVFTCG